jgi:hypothetical protein
MKTLFARNDRSVDADRRAAVCPAAPSEDRSADTAELMRLAAEADHAYASRDLVPLDRLTANSRAAIGDINALGEVDLNAGTVFRYFGKVCFADPDNHES